MQLRLQANGPSVDDVVNVLLDKKRFNGELPGSRNKFTTNCKKRALSIRTVKR